MAVCVAVLVGWLGLEGGIFTQVLLEHLEGHGLWCLGWATRRIWRTALCVWRCVWCCVVVGVCVLWCWCAGVCACVGCACVCVCVRVCVCVCVCVHGVCLC